MQLGDTAGLAGGSHHGCVAVNFIIALNGIFPNRS
jgi:microcystin-dependent protein